MQLLPPSDLPAQLRNAAEQQSLEPPALHRPHAALDVGRPGGIGRPPEEPVPSRDRCAEI